MRTIHRWVMTVFVMLLLYWAGSGVVLAVYDLSDASQAYAFDGGGVGAAGADPGVRVLPQAQVGALLQQGFAALGRVAPGAVLQSAELRMVAGRPETLFTLAAPTSRKLAFDASTGVRVGWPGDEPASQHQTIKTWHRGNIAGAAGQWIALLVALALALLSVTGLWIYLAMYLRRRARGRAAWFWSR